MRVGQTLEVGTGHVVEQEVVLQRKQLTQPPAEVLFERRLVRQQPIQRAVETIVVDPLLRQPAQIFQRGGAIPILRDMQFAGRLGQTCDDQYRRHLAPRDRFAPRRHQLRAQFVELERAPQLPSQPHPTEPAGALDAYAIEAYRQSLRVAGGCFEQLTLGWDARDLLSQQPSVGAPRGVEFSQLRDGFLHHLPITPHRAHQPPIAVPLAVLASYRVPQVQPRSRLLRSAAISQPLHTHTASSKSRHYIAFAAALSKKAKYSLISHHPKYFFGHRTAEVGLVGPEGNISRFI